MYDTHFLAMIESAWEAVGGMSKARQKLAAGKLSQDKAEEHRVRRTSSWNIVNVSGAE